MRALSKTITLGFLSRSRTQESMASTTNCAPTAFSLVHVFASQFRLKNPKTFNLFRWLAGVILISSFRNCHALATAGVWQNPLSSPKNNSIRSWLSSFTNSANASSLISRSRGHCFCFRHLRHRLYRQPNFLCSGVRSSRKTHA